MARDGWPYFDPEYETLSIRINPPSVAVDNASCKDCTVVKVDSVNKPGILLEVVQILSDLDLIITKAYISSDGGWFMDGMSIIYFVICFTSMVCYPLLSVSLCVDKICLVSLIFVFPCQWFITISKLSNRAKWFT